MNERIIKINTNVLEKIVEIPEDININEAHYNHYISNSERTNKLLNYTPSKTKHLENDSEYIQKSANKNRKNDFYESNNQKSSICKIDDKNEYNSKLKDIMSGYNKNYYTYSKKGSGKVEEKRKATLINSINKTLVDNVIYSNNNNLLNSKNSVDINEANKSKIGVISTKNGNNDNSNINKKKLSCWNYAINKETCKTHKFWKRIKILINVIGTVIFLKNEIILFGVTPIKKKVVILEKSQFKKNKVDRQITKSKYSENSLNETIKNINLKDYNNQSSINNNNFLQKSKTLKSMKSMKLDSENKSNKTQFLKKANTFQVYNMTMIEQELDDEENLCELDKKWKNSYLILPNSRFHTIFIIFSIVQIMLFLIFDCFRICFTENYQNVNSKLFYYDICIFALFLINIIINFFVSFVNNEGEVEVNQLEVFLNYLTSWFVIDIICVIPFTFINRIGAEDKYYRITKRSFTELIPFLRIFRLSLKLSESDINEYLSMVLKLNISIIKIMHFLVEYVFINHLFACIWYFTYQVDDRKEFTWIFITNSTDYEILKKYFQSIYFSFTIFHTVGYGDISPSTNNEIIVAIFFMFFSALYYTYHLTLTSHIFMGLQNEEIFKKEKLMMISDFCKEALIEKSIEKELKNFTKEYISKNKDNTYNHNDLKNILGIMPSKLLLKVSIIIFI